MRKPIRYLLTALVCVALPTGCVLHLPAWNSGKLLVIVPDRSLGAEAAFERELVQRFAEHLHTHAGFITVATDEIDQTLRNHRAHMAAATLRSEITPYALHYGPAYQTVHEQLVCNQAGRIPKTLAELADVKVAAVAGSAQEMALQEARRQQPGLHWQSRRKSSAMKLLQEVAEGTLDCAAVNETHFADARLYHPELVVALDVAAPSQLAWAFPRDVDPALMREAERFFARLRQDGTLNRMLNRYYGHDTRFSVMDAAQFVEHASNLLPRYRPLFEEAAQLTGEDWRLLAALAYQESKWDPLATSFTNVRGMMMLTEDTADRMGVSNRLDARESIIAGAKYLGLVREQIPARIHEPDRTRMALAAYNQGYGHIEDARVLAQRNGGNPDRWEDVKKSLLLLNQPEYYETLKNGFARGGEAAVLVENVRSYYELLKRTRPDENEVVEEESLYRLFGPMQRLLQRWQLHLEETRNEAAPVNP